MDFTDVKNDITFRKMMDNEQKTAYLRFNKHNWTKEEIVAYDNVKIKETDEVLEKLLVAEKAHEERKVAQEAETVIKLHNKGKTADEIADLLDMALEKVQQIINKYVESGK
jgi:NTP pyrophosphatase (non-canonical NTP hydrolase)